jgi:twitching motility protein PilU
VEGEKAFRFVFDLVELLLKKDGSDIFITAGCEPAIKANGQIHRVGNKKLNPEQTATLVRAVMSDTQARLFDHHHEANFALNFPNVARFRVSAFQQRGSTGMVLRFIKSEIPTIEQLHLPGMLHDLAMEKRGLVIFVGATGCGKSTSLAAMVDYRNQHTFDHIITLEDPIEFFHKHKKCIVNQREIGTDAENYGIALKNTLRQAPNVILLGEIRDLDTMTYALNFAETGHLVFSTLHANSADQAFDRVLNFFPAAAREQALMDLSFNLKAFISQRLIPRTDKPGSLIPAVEVLINTPLVAELVFQNRIKEIKETMARSSEQGLITFNQSLFQLYEEGKISYESALRNADSVNDLRLTIKLKSKHAPPVGMSDQMSTVQIEEDTRDQYFGGHLG